METLKVSVVLIQGLWCIIFGSEHWHLIRKFVCFPLSLFCHLLSFAWLFFSLTPLLHLLPSQTARLAAVLCSKLAPTLYQVIIMVLEAEDVKINRSGESGRDRGRRRRRARWLTMDLLSIARVCREGEVEFFMRTVTIRKDVDFGKMF